LLDEFCTVSRVGARVPVSCAKTPDRAITAGMTLPSGFEEAWSLLRSGRTVEAEVRATATLAEVCSARAAGSAAWLEAHRAAAAILVGMRQHERARGVLREALAAEPTEDGRPAHVACVEELGSLCFVLGDLEEAKQLGREAVELAPAGTLELASALEARGRTALADDAALASECFVAARRLKGDAASRARLRILEHAARLSHEADADLDLGGITDVHAAIDAALEGCEAAMDGRYDAAIWLVLLDQLRRCVPSEDAVDLVAAIANLAHATGRADACVEARRWLVETYEALANAPRMLDATMGLAYAQGEVGAHEEAEATYRRALAMAKAPLQRSTVLRNLGLYLAERGRRDEADALLREAVEVAGQAWGGGGETVGRALVARGIFLQHGGALEQAAALLEAALEALEPAHPDALPARSHLQAIREDASCGCGRGAEALDAALDELVRRKLPPDLLETIRYQEDGGVDVKLARAPSDEEVAHLDRVVRHAVAEIRRRILESR